MSENRNHCEKPNMQEMDKQVTEKVTLDIETIEPKSKVKLDGGYGYKGHPPGMCVIEPCQEETVKIQKHQGFSAVDCPYCGADLILGRELVSMMAICKRCRQPFKLER